MWVTVKAIVPEVNNSAFTKPNMLLYRQKEQTYTVTKMACKAMKKRESKTSVYLEEGNRVSKNHLYQHSEILLVLEFFRTIILVTSIQDRTKPSVDQVVLSIC